MLLPQQLLSFSRHATLLRRAGGTTLLLLSIAVLARVESTPMLGELARRAEPVLANNPPRIDDVRFVAATGVLSSSALIGDDAYLKPGPFVAVRRRTEMFAWAQGRDGETASYTTGWTENPENSSDFDVPEGHENPLKKLTSRSFVAGDARVGIYPVDLATLTLPPFQSLELAESTLQGNNLKVLPDALFVGKGTIDEPEVGDLRVRYEVLPQTVTVTAFGQVNSGRLEPYVATHGLRLYNMFYGSRESALRKLEPFAGPSPLLFRLLALLAVWLSLCLLTRQLRFDVRLEHHPLAVRLGVLFAAACLLTMITVALSATGGTLWPALLLSALVVLVLLFWDARAHTSATAIASPSVPQAAPALQTPAISPRPQGKPVAAAPTPVPPAPAPAPLSIPTPSSAAKPLKRVPPKPAAKPAPKKASTPATKTARQKKPKPAKQSRSAPVAKKAATAKTKPKPKQAVKVKKR